MLFAFLISSTMSCFNKNAQRSVRAYHIYRQSSSVRGREWCVLCSSWRSQFKHTELCFSTTPITLQNHLWNFIKRHITRKHPIAKDFPSDSAVQNLPANAGDVGDMGSIPGLGRSPGGGDGDPLQYSCLENPMDRGVWPAMVHRVHRVTKSWMQVSTTHSISNKLEFQWLEPRFLTCF